MFKNAKHVMFDDEITDKVLNAAAKHLRMLNCSSFVKPRFPRTSSNAVHLVPYLFCLARYF